MLKPEAVLNLLRANTFQNPLEEARFVRIALFDSPDSPRGYNGLGVQLSGDDMYANVLLLKALKTPSIYPNEVLLSVAEWEWNGGEDLTEKQLEETVELYHRFLLFKINKEVLRLSEELTETEEEYRLGHISSDAFDNIRYSIYRKAEQLWLNEQGPGRFPEWFEDLDVPENLRDVFNNTFGDFYSQML